MAKKQEPKETSCWSCGKAEVSHELEITVVLERKKGGSAAKRMREIKIPQCSQCGGAFQEQYSRRANKTLRGCWGPPLVTTIVLAIAITALAPATRDASLSALPGMFARVFFLSLLIVAIGYPICVVVANRVDGPGKPKTHLERVPADKRFAEYPEVKQALSGEWELYNVCTTKVLEDQDPLPEKEESSTAS